MISCAISLVTVRLRFLLLVALALHSVPTPSQPLDGADVNLERICYISLIVMAKIISSHCKMSTDIVQSTSLR